MATSRTVTLTLGYSNTDFTRKYKFTGVAAEDLANVKTKILAYNANIPAADKKVFISDDYDGSDQTHIVGEFIGIVAAQFQVDNENIINLAE